MKTIVITNQQELDCLPANFAEYTVIEIRTNNQIIVRKACDNSSVRAYDNSSVEAYDNSSVEAYANSSVKAYDNSSVKAYGNSSVRAWGNSSVEAYDNSSVEAYANSSVEAYANSSVKAYGNSSVRAWGNSSVRACDNSSVRAYDNSSVRAYDNSSVRAYDNSSVNIFSSSVSLLLTMCAIAVVNGVKCKIKKKGGQIIRRQKMTKKLFCDGVREDGKIILYKSVNPANGCDFRTGTIKYEIGKEITCPDFCENPEGTKGSGCGGGLHLSPTPEQALSFNVGKVLVCEVKAEDVVVYPPDVSKVRCRKVKVLREWKDK